MLQRGCNGYNTVESGGGDSTMGLVDHLVVQFRILGTIQSLDSMKELGVTCLYRTRHDLCFHNLRLELTFRPAPIFGLPPAFPRFPVRMLGR